MRGAPPFEGIEGIGPDCAANLGTVDHTGAAPQEVYANLIKQIESDLDGVSGWTLSIQLEGDGVLSATTAGTAADRWDMGGLYEYGYLKTEVIDPARNAGRRGVVSAIVFDLDGHPRLLGKSTESMLALELSGSEGSTSHLSVFDGLRGGGQPVPNTVTYAGDSRYPCNRATARIAVRHFALDEFIRGNSNGDGRLDISDALWILNGLFHDGSPSECADAADSNDDGHIDISDAVHLIHYLFWTGEPPPRPFPECGLDLTNDELGCVGGVPPC